MAYKYTFPRSPSFITSSLVLNFGSFINFAMLRLLLLSLLASPSLASDASYAAQVEGVKCRIVEKANEQVRVEKRIAYSDVGGFGRGRL